MVGWIMYYLGDILTEGWICERRMAQFQLYISPILASLVANILATSIREGMLYHTLNIVEGVVHQAGQPIQDCLKEQYEITKLQYLLGSRRLMVVGWSRSKVVKVKEMVSLSA